MGSFSERITIFCFAASYGVALGLEVWLLFRPRPILRLVGLGFAAAGLLAHALYLAAQHVTLVSPAGSLLFLALILAVFALYGAAHHRRLAWGLFVLPLVLGLIGLAVALHSPETPREVADAWAYYWGLTHGVLVLLAAVGVCVGFLASAMYLVQSERLRAKVPPGRGLRLLSLERLEAMHRRAILAAFPLLTAGLIIGVALQLHRGTLLEGWDSPKILGAVGLWLVFAILLHLRYWAHARGRQVALLTMIAFVLLLFSLAAPVHEFGQGAAP